MLLALRSAHQHAAHSKTLHTCSRKASSTCPVFSRLLAWDCSSAAVAGEQVIPMSESFLHSALIEKIFKISVLYTDFYILCKGISHSPEIK